MKLPWNWSLLGLLVCILFLVKLSVAKEVAETTTESFYEDPSSTEIGGGTATEATDEHVLVQDSTTKKQQVVTDGIANVEDDDSAATPTYPTTANVRPSEDLDSPKPTDPAGCVCDCSASANECINPQNDLATPTESGDVVEATTVKSPDPESIESCTTPGLRPDETNCRQYYSCSQANSTETGLRLEKQTCAPNEAFNVDLGRCSRDISNCDTGIVCNLAGSLADPESNKSFYLCEKRLTGGYHLFHVQCGANEVYVPALGKCFIDIKNLLSSPPTYEYETLDDLKVVKAELKQFKFREKLEMKEKKLQEKLEKKLQKELLKAAKEEEKKSKKAKFLCVQEGNFEADVNKNYYYSCVSKKGVLKAVMELCPVGLTFSNDRGACIPPNEYEAERLDKDDDDDNDDDDRADKEDD